VLPGEIAARLHQKLLRQKVGVAVELLVGFDPLVAIHVT
jgi:hypothetical protein